MMNALGKVIYVGKAKNLRSRVLSYFSEGALSPKTRSLMDCVNTIEVTVTSTENEALILEANLIKELRPKYNVLMRDDKSYPFLYLNTNHDFPRLDLYRGATPSQGKLYGPYPNVRAVRENLNFLQKLFKLRQCSDVFYSSRKRPCLQYQIGRCTAPCVDLVTKKQYAEQVAQVSLYLSGRNDEVIKALQTEMNRLAEQRCYEDAAVLRDKILCIREITQGQAPALKAGDVDVFSVKREARDVVIVLLMIRNGQVLGHRSFYPVTPEHANDSEILSAFVMQFYLQPMHQLHTLKRIVLTSPVEQKTWLENSLNDLPQLSVKLVNGRRGRYQSWCDIADKNAKNELTQKQRECNRFSQQLEALQSALHLSDPLDSIECFDISHTSGQNTVASCVVFDRTGSKRKLYRQFNIKGIQGGDDYAAMKQAIMRRYSSLKKRDATMPSLVLIDGGKGQLRQAVEVMEELQLNDILLLAVAKGVSRKPGYETLFLSGRNRAIVFPHDSKQLHCIQTIRDEAHRFAITSHRKKRAKQAVTSKLEMIPGVGVKRRSAILKHFGGFQGVVKASVADLAKVEGINQALADKIYDYLHGDE